MKHFLTLMLLIFMGVFSAFADGVPEYDIEGNGTGNQGTYLVKVSVITKNKKIDDSELVKAAVHGVLFRGFSSKEHRQNQRPVAGSPAVEAQHADYFSSFFGDGGAYRNYGQTVGGSRAVVKSGKKYRVSATVTVNKDQLRKDLEQAGVVRGLNSGF